MLIEKLFPFRLYSKNIVSKMDSNGKPYSFIFFSENESLEEYTSRINFFPRANLKFAVLPLMRKRVALSVLDRSQITNLLRKGFIPKRAVISAAGSSPVPSVVKGILDKNHILDITTFLNVFFDKLNLNNNFKVGRTNLETRNVLNFVSSAVGTKHQKILLYTVDANKPLPSLVFNIRGYILFDMMVRKEIPFDKIMLSVKNGDKTINTLVYHKDIKTNPMRLLAILKKLNSLHKELDTEPEETTIEEEPSAAITNYAADLVDDLDEDYVEPDLENK